MEKDKQYRKIINIDLEEDDDDCYGAGNSNGDDDDDDDDGGDDDDDDDTDNINHLNLGNSYLKTGGINNGAASKKSKHKITKAVKDILTCSNTKFMSNFDPELSNRERRKLTRKFNSEGKKNGSIYDENGFITNIEKDVCDCLVESCPGCHFPCPKCRSCKCGVECRINRKWMYESIENEAEVSVTKNTCISAS